MSNFTPGKWVKRGDFIVGNTVCLAQVLSVHEHEDDAERNRIEKAANARLIAAAPEMYRLICEFIKIDAQKTLAATEKNDPAYMMALVAQDGTVNIAKELIARIDGKEADSE